MENGLPDLERELAAATSAESAGRIGARQGRVSEFTRLLFATAYDGEWDPYIEDFATKIPDEMDIIFSAFEGWPGIHSPDVKDWIVKHQIPAEGWYVAHPDLTVAESARLKRVGNAVDELLDKIGG